MSEFVSRFVRDFVRDFTCDSIRDSIRDFIRPSNRPRLTGWAVALGLAGLVAMAGAGCGGAGTDGTGPSEAQVNVGVLKGLSENSVTVNDFTYDTASVEVQDGFGRPATAEALRLGMWLEVTALVDAASGTARAQSIRIRPAARGVVSAVDRTSLTVTVLQSGARVDESGTVIEGAERAAALVPGDIVEVHGPLGSGSGAFEASRIEKLASGPSEKKPVELRGRVSALDSAAQTLLVGKQPVFYGAATLTLRKALANGQVVRVSALAGPPAGALVREPWRVERLASDQALPESLGFLYAEGITTEWRIGPLFELEELKVDATTATNRSTVSADGQRVAVIGSLAEGTLKAKSVARIVPGQAVVFVLSGSISGLRSAADFRVRSVLVDASAAAFVGGTAAELADGKRARVTGTISGNRLIASRLEFL